MKDIVLPLALLVLSVSPAVVRADDRAAAHAVVATAPASPLAPADRYFGPLRMSVLGIRNGVRDLSVRIDAIDPGESQRLSNLYHKLASVEDSLLDLKAKFPGDSWIPPLGLQLAKAFMKFHAEDAAIHANDTLDWIVADYPASDEAAFARDMRAARLAVGAADDVPIESGAPLQE